MELGRRYLSTLNIWAGIGGGGDLHTRNPLTNKKIIHLPFTLLTPPQSGANDEALAGEHIGASRRAMEGVCTINDWGTLYSGEISYFCERNHTPSLRKT